mgnify:CR=1 FL=1
MIEVLHNNPYVEELKRDFYEANSFKEFEILEHVMLYVSQNQDANIALESAKTATTDVAGMPKDIEAFLKNILDDGDEDPPEPELA